MEEKINKLWETNFTKEDLVKLCDEIYNLGWNSAVKQKNKTISILMKERMEERTKTIKEMASKHLKGLKLTVESAKREERKVIIKEIDKLIGLGTDGVHTYGPMTWQIDKEEFDKLKENLEKK